MMRSANRRHSTASPAWTLMLPGAIASATMRSGSPMDSSRRTQSEATRDAST